MLKSLWEFETFKTFHPFLSFGEGGRFYLCYSPVPITLLITGDNCLSAIFCSWKKSWQVVATNGRSVICHWACNTLILHKMIIQRWFSNIIIVPFFLDMCTLNDHLSSYNYFESTLHFPLKIWNILCIVPQLYLPRLHILFKDNIRARTVTSFPPEFKSWSNFAKYPRFENIIMIYLMRSKGKPTGAQGEINESNAGSPYWLSSVML